MKSPRMVVRIGSAFAVALGLTFAGFAPACAQADPTPQRSGGAKWVLVDAVGYGGLGFGLGVLAAWDLEGPGFGPPASAQAVIGATTAAGTVAGIVIGRRAARAIAEERPIEGLHRAAVIGGGVLAGGTLGALSSIPLIDGPGEGTPLGSDEQTFALLVLAGSALGTFFVLRHRHELGPRSIALVPAREGPAGHRVHVVVSW